MTKKSTLDKDLDKFIRLRTATAQVSRGFAYPGLSLLFLVLVALFVFFAMANASKKGIVLDLKSEAGKETAKKLLAGCDAVLPVPAGLFREKIG